MNVAQPGGVSDQIKLAPLRYRPDIDGLRAVPVLPVLAYHAFPQIVPDDFIGVDIFFVISGYLITGIIRQQMLEARFSIADFYPRRIRRVFPALILVVLVMFIIGWFVLTPRYLQSLRSISPPGLRITSFFEDRLDISIARPEYKAILAGIDPLSLQNRRQAPISAAVNALSSSR